MAERNITPSIQYEDIGAAVEWLHKAFGFEEIATERMEAEDGRVWHSSMRTGDDHFMLGTTPGYESPKRHGGRVYSSLYVRVDDVDAHYERARAAGADVIEELEDKFWGDRTYGAVDLEGHHWYFAQRVREVEDYAPSDDDVKRHLD